MAETTSGNINWDDAKEHFDETLWQYLDLLMTQGVVVEPALKLTFAPLLRRYLDEERSQELYDEMRGVE